MGWSSSGYEQLAGCYGHHNEAFGSIKCGEFCD